MPPTIDNLVPTHLDRLDTYLHRRESRLSFIRANCEKKIIWHGGKREKTAYAIVYVHGFSASRMETWPLCDHLAAKLGANLFYTRLNGHGQDGPAMAGARLEDWLADGLEAVSIGTRIGKRVILIGTSTGGTLATWLAAQPSLAPQIDCLILLSPNFFPKNPMALAALWPPALRLFERLFGSWRSFTVTNREHAAYWTSHYPVKALATMMQLVRRVWQIDLSHASMPVLMMVNPWDRVINVTLAVLRFKRFPSKGKNMIFFTGNKDLGRHVLAGDILSRDTTGRVLREIRHFLDSRTSC